MAGVSTAILDELLDDDRTLDPVTADQLSNHLSMGLVALAHLGATDDRLRAFVDGWRTRLVPRRPATEPIEPEGWAACLGTRRRYGDLLACFTDAIAQDGAETTLDLALGPLLDGLGGAAFHGVIRLAYAIEHARPDDITCGLAYLADVHAPVSAADAYESPSGAGKTIAAVLSELADHPDLSGQSHTTGSFAQRFDAAGANDAFRQVVGQLAVDETTLEQTASAAHALYRSTGDFFALHTVTGTHATRIAIAKLSNNDQRLRAVGALARSVAAAYVAIGTPPINPPRADRPERPDVPDWSSIAGAAIASDDVHVIKMTYSCREEQAAWGNPRYQSTAAAVVGLTPAL